MSPLRPTRITTRVMLLSGAIAVLLGATVVLLVVAVSGQRSAAQAAFRAQDALTAGSELEKSLVTIENGLRGYVASGRRRFLVPADRALAAYPGQLRRLRALASGEPGRRGDVERLADAIDDYAGLWARPLIALADDRLPAARSVVLTRGGRGRLDHIASGFRRLIARERARARERERRAERRSDLAVAFGIGGLGFVLTVAAGLAVLLRRTIVRPVLEVAGATGRLADGDLGARLAADRPDELGDLARSFNAMADSLQASRRELERSNAELEQFASVTSHDLQAPLVTISMYTGLLERREGDDREAEREMLDGIKGATAQARGLIRDLLELARAGRGAPLLEELPAAEAVRRALDSLAGPIAQAGAHVTVGPLPRVRADATSLCRVFQNLIGNAVKFAGERPPRITVSAQRDGASWRFAVRDDGIGLDPRDAERIFGAFARVHGEEDYPGTGIGLAVCERLVAQLGGRMGVESSLGEGSTFWFTLPATVAEARRADRPVAAVPA